MRDMTTSTNYPHIVKSGRDSAQLERLPRIRVAQILTDYLFQGWSADEICIQYPHLLPAEVHSAMAYYFDHSEEIESEIQADVELAEKWRNMTPPSPARLRLRAQGKLPSSGKQ
jgi:hypothetical protein